MQTINQKGSPIILIVVAILVTIAAAVFFYKTQVSVKPNTSPSPSPASLSEDPKFKEVKEKYNLNEEQLQILSTVNPDDND